MTDAQLYEDSFTITSLLDETYDRVARVMGTSADNSVSITLDVNSELFPVHTGEQLNLLMARTLSLDGQEGDASEAWKRQRQGEQTLADLWDYVCYGKVYRHEDPGDGQNM